VPRTKDGTKLKPMNNDTSEKKTERDYHGSRATSDCRWAFPMFLTSTGFSVPALAIRQRAFVRTNKHR
jgi:hypothetical protein